MTMEVSERNTMSVLNAGQGGEEEEYGIWAYMGYRGGSDAQLKEGILTFFNK